MNDSSPFLIMEHSCDDAINWAVRQMTEAGLEVRRTFDLQVARHSHATCPCPHHGTEQCDCQMVVLLVYSKDRQSVSIVVHGYNGQTWFSLVDTPQQRADPRLDAAVRRSLTAQIPPLYSPKNLSPAA